MKSTTRQSMRFVMIGSAAMLAMSTIAQASDTEPSSESECRTIQDAAARLACYDKLQPPVAESAPAPVPEKKEAKAAVSPDTMEPKPLDDKVGRESLQRKDPEDLVKVRGHVVKCPTNARGTYFFVFENGQVWQQKDSKRIAWNECDFEVTIDKDYFGYGMVKDGDDRRIRISRVK